MQRPLGPRVMNRGSSSSNHPTPPLATIGPRTLSPPSARSPAPSLTLNIPSPPSRSPTPRLPPRLAIPDTSNQTLDSGGDSPLFGSYYGGGPLPELNLNINTNPETTTIRPNPPSLNVATCIPQSSSTSSNGPVHVKGLVDNLNDAPLWSDEHFEEMDRLGEGAGGAVHKVKDKRTGKIMARKTITTREAPTKQLLRELSIISSTQHVNIIEFYGAYMSPSSSEVNILMAYGEGGSLETVGKRIKERGAIIGELITGRLAEGVMPFSVVL